MPSFLRRNSYRLFGVALIVLACALYVSNSRTNRMRAKSAGAAALVREFAADALQAHANAATNTPPVKTVAVTHTIEGMDLPPILYPCPDDIATNLLARLAEATGMDTPRGAIDGDLFMLRILDTENRIQQLRAIRPSSRPHDAYVGFFYREEGSEELLLSPPTLVTGAGDLLGQCLKTIVEGGEKLAANPNFPAAFSNLLDRAVQQRAARENVPVDPAPSADAPGRP